VNILYRLEQIEAEHLPLVGYTAFRLRQLSRTGFPVLPGAVISASVFQSFLETASQLEPTLEDFFEAQETVNLRDAAQLQTIAQTLQRAIATAPLSAELLQGLDTLAQTWDCTTMIVHPSIFVLSAPDSQAFHSQDLGLLDSQTCFSDGQPPGNLQRGGLAKAVQNLWAELFRARSLFYWQQQGVALQGVQLAVLIQPVYGAIAGGTVHQHPTQFDIHATVGLGMAIERGEVIPDQYQIDTRTGTVQAQTLGWKTIAYSPADPEQQMTLESANFSQNLLAVETVAPSWLFSTASKPTTPAIAKQIPLPATLEALAAYLIDEPHQHQYALSTSALQQVIQLAQAIARVTHATLDFDWIVCPNTGQDANLDGEHLSLWLTRAFTARLPPLPAPSSSPAPSIISGLGVAPGHAIAPATVVTRFDPGLSIPVGSILVAPTIPLEWLPLIQQAAAIVIEQGSFTSHSAIVARELGIPAIMGVAQATQRIHTGDRIWVDGSQGQVYAAPPSASAVAPSVDLPNDLLKMQGLRSPRRTQLMVNLSQPQGLASAAALPVDGVGLLRSELLAIALFNGQHPLVWLQQHSEAEFVSRLATAIDEFAQAFTPRPVSYRSFDFRLQEFGTQYGSAADSGGDLGGDSDAAAMASISELRGTLSYQADSTLFQLELAALLEAQKMGAMNLRLLLPFVRTVEEFVFCRQLVEKSGLSDRRGFQLWIMAEVPSVLLLLPEYVQAGVQGIAIGTNDLTQLLLGLDRNNPETADFFATCHPAVRHAIAQLVRQSNALGIPCSICGEAPVQQPDLIVDLVRWGIDAVSVSVEAVERTHQAIVQAENN
jgi:pyruvate, water dikinase